MPIEFARYFLSALGFRLRLLLASYQELDLLSGIIVVIARTLAMLESAQLLLNERRMLDSCLIGCSHIR